MGHAGRRCARGLPPRGLRPTRVASRWSTTRCDRSRTRTCSRPATCATMANHRAPQIGRLRRAPRQAAGAQSAARPDRPATAPVPSAEKGARADLDRRQVRRRLARRLVGRGAAGVAMEGLDRPALHAQIRPPARDEDRSAGRRPRPCRQGCARGIERGRDALRRMRRQGRRDRADRCAPSPGAVPAAGRADRARCARRRGDGHGAARKGAGAVGRFLPRDDRRPLSVRPHCRQPCAGRHLRDGRGTAIGARHRHRALCRRGQGRGHALPDDGRRRRGAGARRAARWWAAIPARGRSWPSASR